MFKITLLTGFLLGLSSTVIAGNLSVEVFLGANQRPLSVNEAGRVGVVTIYDLSEPEQIEERISQSLSNNPQQAQKQAKKMLEQNGQTIVREFSAAYQGVLKASEYKLKKLPAIVFNHGESVVYGELNIIKAIHIYTNTKAGGHR